VLVMACVLASCLVCALWVQAGRAALARQRAETAADLAAIAAATSLNDSTDTAIFGRASSPCAAASSVAASNGARLELCVVDNLAGVEVAVRVSEPMAAYSRAHAGPVAES
jgi:secretion/DNA translocation related TadE-like protein